MFPRSLFGFFSALASLIPLRAGYSLARLFVPFHIYCFRGRREAVSSNLSFILGRENSSSNGRSERALTREIFTSFNYFLFEFFRSSSLTKEIVLERVRFHGLENLDSALSKGKGAIIVASHIGNWELGGTSLALLGYKLHVVAGEQLGRRLTPHVRRMKKKSGITVVSPEKGYRDLFLALKKNEIVVLLVDGNLYSTGIEMDFFGKKTFVPRGPAALSIKTGAPIVPVRIVREGRFKFSVAVREPIYPFAGEKEAVARTITEKIVSIQEGDISDYLGQWCIFRRVWP